ncbi:ABC transporter ATP-binding protein [Polluticoccus soli]|uniref:ABC transporter ATP-binding protein n=1 Tax=Polluticoccus soli TaxID=3034150 RepID=UPI0023E2042D|nr:ABC transporter ATP-binding protein [Flavipsychrobacter sp. JY13-12]
MFQSIYERKQKIWNFLSDSFKGFVLIWNSAKRLTIVNLLLFVLQAVIPLFSFIVLKALIDRIITSGNVAWDWAGNYLLAFGGLQLASIVISQLSSYYMVLQQQVISDDIAAKVLHKAVELDLENYENPSFYDELHMVQQQSLYKPAQLMATSQAIIQSLITIVLFGGFLTMVHWSIPVLLILLSIPLAVSKILHGYRQYLLEKTTMPVYRKAVNLFQSLTTDNYAKEVRVFNYGPEFIRQFLHLNLFIFNKKRQLHYQFLKRGILIQSVEIVFTVFIYYILISSVLTGAITIGGLVVYFQVFQRLQGSINSLFQSGIALFQNQLYIRQILNYLAVRPATRMKKGNRSMPLLAKGIQINALDFTYPGTEGRVLHDVNMQLRPGQITAIVGENGSGKSTLIKLLCQLYAIEDGRMLVDGVDINMINAEELRSSTTAIFQDFGRYYLTVEENIALGEEHRLEDRMKEAAVRSGADGFIASLPDGFKTVLGRVFKRGAQLSGGQWQKLALARGFYKNSEIIILDEPTSAMDPIAEYTVFQQLKKDIGNKIVILITHRLYSLKIADHIYVMENGTIVEDGTFSELLKKDGKFSAIYEKQAI